MILKSFWQVLDLGEAEHSHQAAICQSAPASVSSRPALAARGAKTLPSSAFMGHLCVDSTVSPFFPPCKAVPRSYFLHISYFVLLQIITRQLTQAVLFFAQSHNSSCKEGNKLKNKSQWAKWKNTPATLWLRHQPSVVQRLWISSLRLKCGYLNILGLLWLFGLKHLLLFRVFILVGTMKQLYLAWRCTWPTHQFFLLLWRQQRCRSPFGVLEVDVN